MLISLLCFTADRTSWITKYFDRISLKNFFTLHITHARALFSWLSSSVDRIFPITVAKSSNCRSNKSPNSTAFTASASFLKKVWQHSQKNSARLITFWHLWGSYGHFINRFSVVSHDDCRILVELKCLTTAWCHKLFTFRSFLPKLFELSSWFFQQTSPMR